MTPKGLSWSATRRHCLDQGGDLARFSRTTDFWSILKSLGGEPDNKKSAKIWFKWYTWNDEQRTIQNFGEYKTNFQCDVTNPSVDQSGINPLSRCSEGSVLPQVTGLCILPPMTAENAIKPGVTSTCTSRCVDLYKDGKCYDWYTEAEANSLATQPCPAEYKGNATWYCLPNNQWETINPDLRFSTVNFSIT